MNDLIKALTIFQSYLTDKNSRSPLNTSHDTLWIMDVDENVSAEHKAELEKLGFFYGDEAWCSHRFGSA
jgi:ubiquitin-protein ligase